MWIEVEELVALMTDEVVATAWSAACYANALRHLEYCFETCVVDGRDAIDA